MWLWLGRCFVGSYTFKTRIFIWCMSQVKRCINMFLMLFLDSVRIICLPRQSWHLHRMAFWPRLNPLSIIPNPVFRAIAGVHNSEVGHHGLQMCKKRLKVKGFNFTDRMIKQFIRQCPCCQVMNRLRIPIRTHPFTCASYNPFEVLHLDHIGPLKADDKGYTYILVIIDAFSRWVELFPTSHNECLCFWDCFLFVPTFRPIRYSWSDAHGSRDCFPQRVDRWTHATCWYGSLSFHGVFEGGEWHRRVRQSGSHPTPDGDPLRQAS